LFNGGGGDVCDGFCDESCERVCDDHPAGSGTGPVPGMRYDRDECLFCPFYRCDVYDDRLLVLVLVVMILNPFYILNKEINFF
jgi:hypothetical protein